VTLSQAARTGDTVIVTRIDHLPRSTFDRLAIVKEIMDAQAQFRSLAEPWADTGLSVLPAGNPIPPNPSSGVYCMAAATSRCVVPCRADEYRLCYFFEHFRYGLA
jgi:hypothetical protein